jgi:hypothetical protein
VNTKCKSYRIAMCLSMLAMLLFLNLGLPPISTSAQENNPTPPDEIVKLIFIHHSCGENWLTDGNGNLGIALGENNYFVSDTNYGWGPDSIGDNTDIISWPGWFRGPESSRYLTELYNENGQNSDYTRTLPNPGGENQIIMFKSCFPNSNLDGNPDDPPTPGLDLTVGNAKHIYNDLLNYFITRPDKLFIVITAPPVQDPTYANNARAFNSWLVQDWLRENNYPLNNVAVWDFYNILTHPDNHQRLVNGRVEYVISHGDNTSYYATSPGDDHPNSQGNRKATEEFVPMLNVFYNHWKSSTAEPLPVPPIGPEYEFTPTPAGEVPPMIPNDLVDNFESGPPVGSQGWQAFWDEGTQTSITCAPDTGTVHSGTAALAINFTVVPGSWATCSLLYDQNQDWRSATGLSFYVHASLPGSPFDVITYGGAPSALEGYSHSLETTQEMVDGWVKLEFSWDSIRRVEWEENAGTPFDPGLATGMAFGIGSLPEANNEGKIWIDEVRLIAATAHEPAAVEQPSQSKQVEPELQESAEPLPEPTNISEPSEQDEVEGGRILPCSSALAIAIGVFGIWASRQRK